MPIEGGDGGRAGVEMKPVWICSLGVVESSWKREDIFVDMQPSRIRGRVPE